MENSRDYKPAKIKRLFLKVGACSHLFFHILNRHYKQPRLTEEKASDPLAGGILQAGHQCGMLWGAAMAAGAESHRRFKDENIANGMAILATQNLMQSFMKRAKHVNCRAITKCNWKKPGSVFRYFITGKAVSCFRLADKWAPEAIQAAEEALNWDQSSMPSPCLSCTAELAKMAGVNQDHIAMVSGLAGGMGLSGQACSALATAIWLKSIKPGLENEKIKTTLSNPELTEIQDAFMQITDKKILCQEIAGKKFNELEEHSKYIQSGGCEVIISKMAELSRANT